MVVASLAKAPRKTVSAKGPTQGHKRLERTFRRKALEQSFLHFCQLHCPIEKSCEDFEAMAKRFYTEKIRYIDNVQFTDPALESSLFKDALVEMEQDETTQKNVRVRDLPAHLARLCEARLLTPEDEVLLFTRMNFLRFKASKLQSKLVPGSKNCWTIRRIDGLTKAADWYRDAIVKSNMRLVISIVKKFVNTQNSFDDLLSDGIVSLIRAVEKFDVALGYRFSTYATQVVRRSTYRLVMEKQKEREKNVGNLHENDIDVCDELRSPSMSEQRWTEMRTRLASMLDLLDKREKLIVRARFSLGGHRRVQTLQRLADVLGVSKERIRQLEKRALDKLRGMVKVAPLPEFDA